jgi:lipoprotein LpqB-like beta-propeller protein/sporulation and spore germination protein
MRPARRRGRRPVDLLLLVAAALVLSGCVSIPQSSQIQPGRELSVQDEPQHVTNDPPGPRRGDSRRQVAAGFFAAMLAYPQTVTTARQYLTASAAAHWEPSAKVVIYNGQGFTPGRGGVAVRAQILGSLDRRGVWASVRPHASRMALTLRLLKVRGQWRIANPPPGLYIDNEYFENDYKKFALYFFDPSKQVLAADPVYLVDDHTAASALVADLVQGPTSSLSGAVTTEIPKQTRTAVSVSASLAHPGQANVLLSDDILRLSPADRQLAAAQLAWTLRQVSEIHTLSISVDGRALDVPGFGTAFSVDSFNGYDPAGLTGERRLFALSDKGVFAVAQNNVAAVLQAPDPRSAAVDTKGALVAYVTSDGSSVVVAGIPPGAVGRSTWVSHATSLLRPSWDFRGLLWVVDKAPNGSTIKVATGKAVRTVRAPGLAGSDIVSFAVSRDGVRFAAIVRRAGTTRLEISIIDRDRARHERVRLGPPRTVLALTSRTSGVQLRDMSQLSWVSPTAVVVLASGDAGVRHPWQVEIDGSRTTDVGQFLPVRPVSLAAGANPQAPIAVGARDGQLYLEEPDLQWVRIGEGPALRMPSYAG